MTYAVMMTQAGLAAFADAFANETAITLATVAVGDGGGAPITPTGLETALVNEVDRCGINSVGTDPDHDSWVVVSAELSGDQGGYVIRELGVFDDAGVMMAIASYPEQYKPQLTEGFGEDLTLTLIMAVANAASVTIEAGSSTSSFATTSQVERAIKRRLTWYVKNW